MNDRPRGSGNPANASPSPLPWRRKWRSGFARTPGTLPEWLAGSRPTLSGWPQEPGPTPRGCPSRSHVGTRARFGGQCGGAQRREWKHTSAPSAHGKRKLHQHCRPRCRGCHRHLETGVRTRRRRLIQRNPGRSFWLCKLRPGACQGRPQLPSCLGALGGGGAARSSRRCIPVSRRATAPAQVSQPVQAWRRHPGSAQA